MRRYAKSSATAFVDATLLVLLRYLNGSGVDAFAGTHLQNPTRWPKHRDHSGTRQHHQQLCQSLPARVGQAPAPAASNIGCNLKRARLHALHGSRSRRADGEVPGSAPPAGIREAPPASPAVSNGIVTGAEGGMGGFGWLREFGNGKMDIAGLVLSTVLLMTAAAPLG